jgi:phenylalanyl-tRNA synthetase beta chain
LKVSLNWLNEFVDLKEIPAIEIAQKLTMAGLEVEEIVDQNKLFQNFVVGLVTEKLKHPKADKLSLCKVSIGSDELQVVCGAPNVEEGQKVILARIGAVIPSNGMEIVKVKIRGIESFGMLCSEAELMLSNDHSGIVVLDPSLITGMQVSEALGLNDVIFEIGITPNRPDALSHIGVARDLAALFNLDLKMPKHKSNISEKNISDFASVEIIDPENCPRYSAKVVLGVEIKESPAWLKRRLEAVGLRSINNVVDVTNYVNFELGQPLHAFDLDKLDGNKIVVKNADDQLTFTTLDSKERKLNSSVLMICDGARPVAIAGVMGGENSEVTKETKNLLIESAYFNPKSIRKTSKFLGLSTDSSFRFERGTNPYNTLVAAERAAELIVELGGGEVVSGSIDVYPNTIKNLEVELRLSKVEKILGYKISEEKCVQILKSLGFEIISCLNKMVRVKVPLFRPDIEREIDLIEEIARIDGYDNIPAISKINITLQERFDESAYVNELRNIVVGLGFNEIYCNSLINEDSAQLFGEPIKLQNPLGIEMAFLRTSLIPGGLETIKKNFNVGEKNLRIFEVGNTFNKFSDNLISFSDFKEEQKLLLMVSGKATAKQWFAVEREFDFFDIKSIINSIFSKLNLDYLIKDSYYNSGNNIFDYSMSKSYENNVLCLGGKLKIDILKIYDIKQDVFCFEIYLEELKKIGKHLNKFKELLRFPKVHRDFSFILDKHVAYEDVKKVIEEKASSNLKNISLYDVFEHQSLGNNKKSLTFRLEFFNEERTLTEEEVEKDFNNLINEIRKVFNAVLRGS